MGCFSEFNDYTGCFSLISNESSPILRLIGWAVWHLMVPFSIRQHSFLGGGVHSGFLISGSSWSSAVMVSLFD